MLMRTYPFNPGIFTAEDAEIAEEEGEDREAED